MFPLLFILFSITFSFNIEQPPDRTWSKYFLPLFRKTSTLPKKIVAVACPDEHSVIKTISLAYRIEIADFILVGDENNIRKLAKNYKIDLSGIKIINETNKYLAALTAVKLVHDNEADILMRGSIPIKDFIKAVKDNKVGLYTGKIISYIIMAEIKGYDQLLFLTDGEIVTRPSLEDKVHLIENAVEMSEIFGLSNPKVAALSSIEYIDKEIKSSIEADILKKMNEEGKIKNCIIEGPISMDMAISIKACIDKNAYMSKIKGDANILLFPDFEASNMSWRLVKYLKVIWLLCYLVVLVNLLL